MFYKLYYILQIKSIMVFSITVALHFVSQEVLSSVLAFVKVSQSCLTLCGPMDCTVHGILQARILEWVVVPFSRASSQPRNWTLVSHIAGRFFTSWALSLSNALYWIIFFSCITVNKFCGLELWFHNGFLISVCVFFKKSTFLLEVAMLIFNPDYLL